MPLPSPVMTADVAAGTWNCSAANATTAVNGASAGTLILCRGERGRARAHSTQQNNRVRCGKADGRKENGQWDNWNTHITQRQKDLERKQPEDDTCARHRTTLSLEPEVARFKPGSAERKQYRQRTYTRNGSFGSDVSVILNETLASAMASERRRAEQVRLHKVDGNNARWSEAAGQKGDIQGATKMTQKRRDPTAGRREPAAPLKRWLVVSRCCGKDSG